MDADAFWRVLLLQDYNTRVVVAGTSMLGFASGLVGCFTLLRRRALVGDALAHATLPGIALAFLIVSSLGGNGKSLPNLLIGAAVSGLLGIVGVLVIRRGSRLKEDAALGIILSVFFGAGIALLGIVQQTQTGHAAGLESFIYGKTATMVAGDAWLIAITSSVCIAICLGFFKELKMLCFDEAFTGSRGYRIVPLDAALMAVVVSVTIIGLQAVGLVLVIALLVIPAAAARFWTDRLITMMALASLLGMLGCFVGAVLSAMAPRLPSGAMIVLTTSSAFAISFLVGRRRGVLVRWWRRRRLNRSIDRQHLLRELYQQLESPNQPIAVSIDSLLQARSWPRRRLQQILQSATSDGLVSTDIGGRQFALTHDGTREARRLTRNHRLWELYLIHHADVAPQRVDRDADAIEHVLEPETVAELEVLLNDDLGRSRMPGDPHAAG